MLVVIRMGAVGFIDGLDRSRLMLEEIAKIDRHGAAKKKTSDKDNWQRENKN
jgi:hypothetical protein